MTVKGCLIPEQRMKHMGGGWMYASGAYAEAILGGLRYEPAAISIQVTKSDKICQCAFGESKSGLAFRYFDIGVNRFTAASR